MTPNTTLWVILLSISWNNASIAKLVIPGSVVFKQRWSDFRAAVGSSQYQAMTANIERAIKRNFEGDPDFQGITVTQLREDHATKKSTIEGHLTADFKLYLWHKSVTGLERLRDQVLTGYLGRIPVKKHSLYLQDMPVRKSDFLRSYNTWPSGTYGLPKPVTGCYGNGWREGFRYHDTENFMNENTKSNSSHLAGNVTRHGIRQEFCIHMNEKGTGSSKGRPWPMGKYCVYKKGTSCPVGLEEGWVRWDDENTAIDYPSSYDGAVPEGLYGQNTLIYFCCDSRGDRSTAIWLPHGQPFYLIAFGSEECQKVHRYEATSEFLYFDDEDRANRNQHSVVSPYGLEEDLYNTKIYYCYYRPLPCDAENRDDPTCFSLQPSRDHDETDYDEDNNESTMVLEDRASRHRRAFAVGSGVGIILIGTATFAVMLKRFVTRRSWIYYY